MNNADYLRELRTKAAADGKCYVCRCRTPRPGIRTCDHCLGLGAALKAKIAGKRCQYCFEVLHRCRRGLALCYNCEERDTRYAARRSDVHVAFGICGRCRVRPLATSFHCSRCRDNIRDSKLAAARRDGRKPRPCPVCRALGIDGTGHDRRTHDRWVERAKQWASVGVSL